jgi:hypothetical protein
MVAFTYSKYFTKTTLLSPVSNLLILHRIFMRWLKMKCNVGKSEQIIRIIFGIGIILLGLYFRNWWGLIGLLPIITGTIRYCPISTVLGVSTCKDEDKQ